MNEVEASSRAPARSAALAAQYYLGEASLDRDFRQVLARHWQLVGHASQLSDPGDHVVTTVGRTPVLVVRHPDEGLVALANVCRHRAGPIATCNGRRARSLHCRYHGWTYDLGGQLRHAPEMGGAEDFDPTAIRLPRFHAAQWQGLVFVSLGGDAPPLEEVYGGIASRIAPIDLSTMTFARRDSYDIACNWKVYVDNYLEGYHVPYIHPGLAKVVDYAAYRTELAPWHSLQTSPLRNNEGIYGDGDAYYYFVYPNVMLNIMPGRLQVNRVLANGPDRCLVEFDYYYAPDDAARARAERDREFSEEIQQEDVDICEAVQRGLASGTYDAGRLCPKREAGVWHFHELLRRDYARSAP
jgi:choline monooxygenase